MIMTHRTFFGETEYNFKLTFPLIRELEHHTGEAANVVFTRIFNRAFFLSDLTETIRFALIGGGVAPKRAAELVATYATNRPLEEIYPLALAIADATWFGKEENGQA